MCRNSHCRRPTPRLGKRNSLIILMNDAGLGGWVARPACHQAYYSIRVIGWELASLHGSGWAGGVVVHRDRFSALCRQRGARIASRWQTVSLPLFALTASAGASIMDANVRLHIAPPRRGPDNCKSTICNCRFAICNPDHCKLQIANCKLIICAAGRGLETAIDLVRAVGAFLCLCSWPARGGGGGREVRGGGACRPDPGCRARGGGGRPAPGDAPAASAALVPGRALSPHLRRGVSGACTSCPGDLRIPHAPGGAGDAGAHLPGRYRVRGALRLGGGHRRPPGAAHPGGDRFCLRRGRRPDAVGRRPGRAPAADDP